MKSNLTRCGQQFQSVQVLAVWEKGHVIAGQDPNIFREDVCGTWMSLAEYGRTVDLGWEIDHIIPVAKGGADNLANLQPLQWANNRQKSDHWPWFYSDAA